MGEFIRKRNKSKKKKKVNNHHHLLRHLLGDAFCGVWASEGLFSGKPLDFLQPSTHTQGINLENTGWLSGKRWEDDIFWFFSFLSRFYKLSQKHLQFLENHRETILYHNRHVLVYNLRSSMCLDIIYVIEPSDSLLKREFTKTLWECDSFYTEISMLLQTAMFSPWWKANGEMC